MQSVEQKRTPAVPFIALMAGGLSVMLILLLTPWNLAPVQVAEDVTVIAVTEHGCVGESSLGVSVVVEQCAASVGDVVPAEFFVPAMEQNGYYDAAEERLAALVP